MKKLILAFLILTLSTFADAASNWYVRPSGGSNTGTSWTAAWNELNGINWSTVQCGDTIWVAGGTYEQDLVTNKVCTSGTRIYVRRARTDATECTGAAGWSSSYASTVHNTAGITVDYNSAYITVSGRTTASGGSYGWWIDLSATTGGAGIGYSDVGANYLTFEYMDIQGPGYITYTNDGRAVDLTAFGAATQDGNVFSHLKIWDWESGIYAVSCGSPTFEYIEMYDIAPVNSGTYHPNGIITWNCPNGILRYSHFYRGPSGHGVGEGMFFEQTGGSTAWQIYGNVFAHLDSTGLKAIEITSAVGAIKVFNNTFADILAGSLFTSDSPSCVGGEWRNNLNYESSNDTCGTASNNIVAAGTNAFVDYAGDDFHITSTTGTNYPRNAGTNLSSYFTVDMDGNTFGADGTWDIGAYEYASGGSDTTPDTFSFTDNTNAPRSTVIYSDPITVAGINAASEISISGTGCEFKINAGACSSTSSTVVLNDVVRYCGTSSASAGTTYPSCTLTIGGVPDSGAPWTATTTFAPVTLTPSGGAPVGWPVSFTWNAVTGASLYQIQVDDNSDFSSPEVDDATIDPATACTSVCTYNVQSGGALQPETRYYWRVRTLH